MFFGNCFIYQNKTFGWSGDEVITFFWMQGKRLSAMETLTSISRVQEWLRCTVTLKTMQEPSPSSPVATNAPWMAWQSQSLYDCLKVHTRWMVWGKIWENVFLMGPIHFAFSYMWPNLIIPVHPELLSFKQKVLNKDIWVQT